MPSAPTIISDNCSAVLSSLATGCPPLTLGAPAAFILRSRLDSRQSKCAQTLDMGDVLTALAGIGKGDRRAQLDRDNALPLAACQTDEAKLWIDRR
jgi:hypothetical protein